MTVLAPATIRADPRGRDDGWGGRCDTVVCVLNPIAPTDEAAALEAAGIAERHGARLILVGATSEACWWAVVQPFVPVAWPTITAEYHEHALCDLVAAVPPHMAVTVQLVPRARAIALIKSGAPDGVLHVVGRSLRTGGRPWDRLRSRRRRRGRRRGSPGRRGGAP